MEGILTVLVGALGALLLVGFPDDWTPKWKFLTEREVRWVIDTVNRDRGDATVEAFSIGKFLRPALDWKIWMYALMFFNTTTISYALAYFLPTMLQGIGYDHFMAQIMAAPPYAFAGLIMAFCGWAGDKWRIRGPLVVMNMSLCVIGLCLMAFSPDMATGVKLFGIFLVAAGANANIPVIMTYQVSSAYLTSKHTTKLTVMPQANNIRGQWKRAFCSASMVGFGGLGGIAGSLLFKEEEASLNYPTGMKGTIIMSSSNIVLVAILAWRLNAANKKSRAGQLKIEGAEVILARRHDSGNADRCTHRTDSSIPYERIAVQLCVQMLAGRGEAEVSVFVLLGDSEFECHKRLRSGRSSSSLRAFNINNNNGCAFLLRIVVSHHCIITVLV